MIFTGFSLLPCLLRSLRFIELLRIAEQCAQPLVSTSKRHHRLIGVVMHKSCHGKQRTAAIALHHVAAMIVKNHKTGNQCDLIGTVTYAGRTRQTAGRLQNERSPAKPSTCSLWFCLSGQWIAHGFPVWQRRADTGDKGDSLPRSSIGVPRQRIRCLRPTTTSQPVAASE